jgi:dipeptidyl aminopeptidase/acylaminoacyl peptidase
MRNVEFMTLTPFLERNAWRLVNYFGGYPWEPKIKEILARESPLTYVENIKTPFIIFTEAMIARIRSGEMLFRSLKVLGRPVEYVVPEQHMKLPEVEITDNEWINC